MNLKDFKASLVNTSPPTGLSPLPEALWFDAKGDWQKAHELAQDVDTPNGSWVHAYLHRKEGDLSNAGYWYAKAGRKMPGVSLAAEWAELVESVLKT